jgi:hypothetical protein
VSPSNYYRSALPDLARQATDARALALLSYEKYCETPEEVLEASVPALVGVECIFGQMIGHRRIASRELSAGNLDDRAFELIDQLARATNWDWETLTNGLGMLKFNTELNKSAEFSARVRDKHEGALAIVREAGTNFQEWWRIHRSDYVPTEVPELDTYIAMAEEDFFQGTGRSV